MMSCVDVIRARSHEARTGEERKAKRSPRSPRGKRALISLTRIQVFLFTALLLFEAKRGFSSLLNMAHPTHMAEPPAGRREAGGTAGPSFDHPRNTIFTWQDSQVYRVMERMDEIMATQNLVQVLSMFADFTHYRKEGGG